MALAVVAGWAATFVVFALAALAFVMADDPVGGMRRDLENATGALAYAVIGVGAPMLAISAALGLGIHHVLSRRGHERRIGWYLGAGALVGGIVLPIVLQIAINEWQVSLIGIPVGAILCAANAGAFGAVVRKA